MTVEEVVVCRLGYDRRMTGVIEKTWRHPFVPNSLLKYMIKEDKLFKRIKCSFIIVHLNNIIERTLKERSIEIKMIHAFAGGIIH
jgi:hypothetical protein